MAALIERRRELEAFAVFHMRGHWDSNGNAMVEAIRREVGDGTIPVRNFPWWLVRSAAPIVPFFRKLAEMRYLWRLPLRMSNPRLVEFLGQEPHTPLDEAVRATLDGLGCLVPRQPTGAAALAGRYRPEP